MSFLTNIVSVWTPDVWTTIFSFLICFVAYKLTKFYVKVFSLPPGPIPLPLVGNILHFRGSKEHWSTVLEKAADIYGPVFTIWMGSTPLVFISDIDIGREMFRKNEFAGRPASPLNKLFSNEKYTDIGLAEYGPRWEALRRVTHSAVVKYSTTDKLIYLVRDCVEDTIKTIIDREGVDKPFNPNEYIYNLFLNIMANSAFGKRYDMEDPEYKSIRYVQKGLFEDYSLRMIFWEFIPILTKIDRINFNKMMNAFKHCMDLIKNKYQSHYKDYDESVIRDFCDALITAKNDALREGKESAPYLKDENLSMAVVDLFLAGTDTSQRTFIWILFYMTYDTEVMKRLRQEIENEIGDRIPTHEDRNRCNYAMAFISEVLRIRNINHSGVNHQTVVNTKIGDFSIPEGTQVTVYQGHILHNERYWENSQEFRPERFLENGKYITTRPKAFIPFGVGRRVCLGEKLAMSDLFLVLVTFLQSEYEVKLHFEGNAEPDPNNSTEIVPRPFKIAFVKK